MKITLRSSGVSDLVSFEMSEGSGVGSGVG
jgi:hypothetical protein